MNQMVPIAETGATTLPDLVSRAASQLASATTAAEVLEAKETAGAVYDAAKRAARLGKAKKAHDDLIAAAYRAQADALEIESQAKRRLADEYDAAQERGEVAANGQRGKAVPDGNSLATAADIGLSRKDIHDARQVRDAEEAHPGIVRQILDQRIAAGEEPTRAALRRDMDEARRFRESLPSRAEADKIAADNGTAVLGRDGKFHSGTPEEAKRRSRVYLAVNQLLYLTHDYTPEDAAQGCPPRSRAEFSKFLAAGIRFLSNVKDMLDVDQE